MAVLGKTGINITSSNASLTIAQRSDFTQIQLSEFIDVIYSFLSLGAFIFLSGESVSEAITTKQMDTFKLSI